MSVSGSDDGTGVAAAMDRPSRLIWAGDAMVALLPVAVFVGGVLIFDSLSIRSVTKNAGAESSGSSVLARAAAVEAGRPSPNVLVDDTALSRGARSSEFKLATPLVMPLVAPLVEVPLGSLVEVPIPVPKVRTGPTAVGAGESETAQSPAGAIREAVNAATGSGMPAAAVKPSSPGLLKADGRGDAAAVAADKSKVADRPRLKVRSLWSGHHTGKISFEIAIDSTHGALPSSYIVVGNLPTKSTLSRGIAISAGLWLLSPFDLGVLDLIGASDIAAGQMLSLQLVSAAGEVLHEVTLALGGKADGRRVTPRPGADDETRTATPVQPVPATSPADGLPAERAVTIGKASRGSAADQSPTAGDDLAKGDAVVVPAAKPVRLTAVQRAVASDRTVAVANGAKSAVVAVEEAFSGPGAPAVVASVAERGRALGKARSRNAGSRRDRPEIAGAEIAAAATAGAETAAPVQKPGRVASLQQSKADAVQARPHIKMAGPDVALIRGRKMLEIANIAAARALLQRSASKGSSEAAILLGRTYDPSWLSRKRVFGITADKPTARKWYEEARRLGSAEAIQLLSALDGG